MKKKTTKDVIDLLLPLYKKGKPFIIKEKDYLWVQKVICPWDKHKEVSLFDEPIYFDTIKTKTKPEKLACAKCAKTTGKIEFHQIDDEVLALHAGCLPNIPNK